MLRISATVVDQSLGCMAAPVADFLQTFSAGVFEKPYFVASMFEFVNVSPYFCLPGSFVRRRLAATGTTCVKSDARPIRSLCLLQFEENTTHFFNLFVGPQDVFVSEQVAKA